MGHPGELKKNTPKIIVGASEVSIEDIDGHKAIDAVGGLGCVNVGYSCDPIKNAITEQLNKLPYYSSFAGTSNDAAIELSYELNQWFEPEGMARAFFTSGGSDSVESALRLARQYHKVRGDLGRTKFFSLKKGYHGTHFGGASVNGNQRFRTAYEPLLAGCHHMPSPYTFRNPFNETNPDPIKAIISSASIPFAFPHQLWNESGAEDVVCMDGGTMYNENLVSAVTRCREQVEHDSQITIDIIVCSAH